MLTPTLLPYETAVNNVITVSPYTVITAHFNYLILLYCNLLTLNRVEIFNHIRSRAGKFVAVVHSSDKVFGTETVSHNVVKKIGYRAVNFEERYRFRVECCNYSVRRNGYNVVNRSFVRKKYG